MKKGLILINAYSALPSALNQSERLKEELAALGVAAELKRNNFFPLSIGENGRIESRLEDYDFCVYLDKDKYVSSLMEKEGLRLFNRHAAVEACDDKMTTHILLSENGVPMPETVPGLLCYNPEAEISGKTLDFLEKKLGYPMIAKASYGSLGRDVYKIDDRAQLIKISEELKCRSHLFQRCIKESVGRDLRVIVAGGKVVAAMERKSQNDFRSNIELGGRGTPVQPDSALKNLCLKVSEIIGLDYCGIDVLEGEDGYLVCEVNSNAFFGGIEKVTGINVARAYAEHIYSSIYG